MTDRLGVSCQLVPEAREYLSGQFVESQFQEPHPGQRWSQFRDIWKAQVAMADFWLVRHGQTDWNRAGRWQGQTLSAPPLNDTGRAQALAVCDQLMGLEFSAIYSSDLLRSRQTAELIAEGLRLPIVLEPRLREMNLGAWEGRLSEEIEAEYSRELVERGCDPLNMRAPQGESPRDVAERVIPALAEIAAKHREKSVLIISHGIPLALMACCAQGISLEKVYENIPRSAEPFRLEWR
ncbi:MAG TPA: histidine phosphatase family protein [Anaerolineales bacterium]|nr:histidine phosphatase family protein [Anaerolineales bacterium]